MIQPQTLLLVPVASVSNANYWLLTSTGAFTNAQTITIAGVVFTTVTALSVGPAVAGEVLIGLDAAATLTNLTAAINAPDTTSVTFTALSAADAQKIKFTLGLSATTTATIMTLVSSNKSTFTVSETQTNAAWTSGYLSPTIGVGQSGRMSFQFTAASISSGNGVFTVEVSNDGSNFVVYNRMTTNVTNTNAQTDTRVASVTLNSNTSSVVSIPDSFALYRVRVVMTTDGVYSASGLAV
jgi:hypothetical protein